MSVVRPFEVVICDFLVFWFQVVIEPFGFFHHVSLCCFTDEVDDSYSDQTYMCFWSCIRTKGRFRASKSTLSPMLRMVDLN